MSKLNLHVKFGGSVDVTNVANGETFRVYAFPDRWGEGVVLEFIEDGTVNREHKFQIERPERKRQEASQP